MKGRSFSEAERRARLVRRHGFGVGLVSVEETSEALVGLHSSDPVTVFLSAWARVPGLAPRDVERALYEERTVLRLHAMRRTLFVVPVHLGAVMNAACTISYHDSERRRLERLLEEQGHTEDATTWLSRVGDDVVSLLERIGPAAARRITEDVPELTLKLAFGEGKTWGGTVGVSTRVLFLLATEGRIVRGRPLGSWISSQYEWAAMPHWLPGGLVHHAPDDAVVELAGRWLAAYGPGTLDDLRWWTGWTVARTRRALAKLDALEVALDDGSTGFVLPDDVDPVEPAPPVAALLPSLDPTVMGWKERGWYLGGHTGPLFDRNGNAGPTVWWDGRIVGGWAQRADGEIALRLLEDVPIAGRGAIDAEADRLRTWLGDTRFTPRFRTPLEQSLLA